MFARPTQLFSHMLHSAHTRRQRGGRVSGSRVAAGHHTMALCNWVTSVHCTQTCAILCRAVSCCAVPCRAVLYWHHTQRRVLGLTNDGPASPHTCTAAGAALTTAASQCCCWAPCVLLAAVLPVQVAVLLLVPPASTALLAAGQGACCAYHQARVCGMHRMAQTNGT